MTNYFIKNLILCDSLSNYTNYNYVQNETTYIHTANSYYIFSPNILLIELNDSTILYNKKNMINLNNSSVFKKFLNLLDNYGNDFTIDNIIKNYNIKFNDNYDNSFMEIALFIPLIEKTIEDIIKSSLKIITKITNNGIKILCFISIAIFSHLSELNKKKETWIHYLIDLLIENKIDKYIKNIISTADKKKFLLMLLQYSGMNKKNTYCHIRIQELDDICFITKIQNTSKYIPGEVPDQLLIICYDFLIDIKTWSSILSNICFAYIDNIYINFIITWLYFRNNNINIIKYYNLENEYNLKEIINLQKIINNLFSITKV